MKPNQPTTTKYPVKHQQPNLVQFNWLLQTFKERLKTNILLSKVEIEVELLYVQLDQE